MRRTLLVIMTIATLLARARHTAADATSPDELVGSWRGTASHDGDSTAFGLIFQKVSSGKVLARVWMPELNSYGSAVGWLTATDSGLVVPEAPMRLTRTGDAWTGFYYQPSLRFEVRRTDSLSREPAPPPVGEGPEPLWTYRAGAPLWASPVVFENTVFVGDTAGRFHAVDATTGHATWTFDAGTPLFGEALVTGDAVYVLGDDGRLFKRDRRTGHEAWTSALGGGTGPRVLPSNDDYRWDFTSPAPVLAGSTLYIGTADGVFHAVDARTGGPQWSFRSGGKIRASARVAGNRVVFGSTDGFVYALDRTTGKLDWKFDTGSPATSAPEVAGHRIVVGTRDQATLHALDAGSGRVLWRSYWWLSWVESAARFVDGLLYIGSSDSRRVRVLGPSDGRPKWVAQVWGWTWGTPLPVGNRVYYATAGAREYFVTQRASVGALDRKTGALVWRRPIADAATGFLSGVAGSLAEADGRVIVAGLDGTLIALPAR